jgi:tRNA-modifying protein YgfZ
MTDPASVTLRRLEGFAVIAVTGPDAKSFLQGQLSFDLDRLTPARAELAACSSAQGRVQAVLWLIERSDVLLLVLPTSVAAATLIRLRKYVLRAKVKLEISTRFAVFAATGLPVLGEARTHLEDGERSYVQWPGGERVLCLAAPESGEPDAGTALEWHRADIEAGLPQVFPETIESFVAQMLNLDALGGISFEKGCYTGQEIIARMHFRGAAKRRMFRLRSEGPPPAPGARILVNGQHAGDVADAVATEHGAELLAVISLSHADAALQLESGAMLTRLPLPYQV